jgi:hypothetical protein
VRVRVSFSWEQIEGGELPATSNVVSVSFLPNFQL